MKSPIRPKKTVTLTNKKTGKTLKLTPKAPYRRVRKNYA